MSLPGMQVLRYASVLQALMGCDSMNVWPQAAEWADWGTGSRRRFWAAER